MSSLVICIVDYGVGNTHSVANAISFLDYRVKISNQSETIRNADVLILPGVGAFEVAVNNLTAAGLPDLLNELVIEKQKPILGICVGMQMMATYSEENGHYAGLNWIPGAVVKLNENSGFPVPHVGWNTITPVIHEPLFAKANNESHFYFDHSYYFKPDSQQHIAATVNYGQEITAAIQFKNICGVQFHPEKSQTNGLKLFRSFVNGVLEYA
jgi:glutamine amidotransferase